MTSLQCWEEVQKEDISHLRSSATLPPMRDQEPLHSSTTHKLNGIKLEKVSKAEELQHYNIYNCLLKFISEL